MTSNELGKFLRSLRKAHGYTQEFVASKLNIIYQTYSHYENGRIVPSGDALFLLARLYQIPVEQLLKLTVPPSERDDDLPSSYYPVEADELNSFLEYISKPSNCSKYKNLSPNEKRLLYYFQQLTYRNQSKLIEMAKVEVNFQEPTHKKEEPSI